MRNTNNHLTLTQKRKVGVGIDLSEVVNETFKPEKDNLKISNSFISDKDRSKVYVNTKNTDLLSKRYANISTNYDFMKSFEELPKSKGKRRLSVENQRKQNSPELEVKSIKKSPYDFGLEYYTTGPNNSHQDEYLDKVSRKKQIGPYHNSVSSNFVLPTFNSKNAGRNAQKEIMKNSVSEVRKGGELLHSPRA